MTERIDTVVISSPDSEQQPITENNTKEKEAVNKEYMQDYYLRHKGAYTCEHCERIYTCRSSLVKDQGRSVTCYVERIKTVFDDIKHTPAKEFNQKNVLAKMETIIPTK